jgi:hypothetical protein
VNTLPSKIKNGHSLMKHIQSCVKLFYYIVFAVHLSENSVVISKDYQEEAWNLKFMK